MGIFKNYRKICKSHSLAPQWQIYYKSIILNKIKNLEANFYAMHIVSSRNILIIAAQSR